MFGLQGRLVGVRALQEQVVLTLAWAWGRRGQRSVFRVVVVCGRPTEFGFEQNLGERFGGFWSAVAAMLREELARVCHVEVTLNQTWVFW